MQTKPMNYTHDNLKKLSSTQLDTLYTALQEKTKEIHKLINQKLIEENRDTYLKKWANLASLPETFTKYFIRYANITDFIIENGYYHYMSKYGCSMTLQVWSCRWLLEQRGDYVSYHQTPEGHNLVLKYPPKIHITDLSDTDPNLITTLTEYVIYKAVEKDPRILCITTNNQLFAGNVNYHFHELDKIRL